MAGSSGMSYARNLLEKYGWTEGKGLGKAESGMVEALKPKLKFDNTGIGHDHAEQFTFNWWEIAFSEAAKRVSVSTSTENPDGELGGNSLNLSTRRPSVTKLMKENPLKYGKFIKTETLTNGGKVVPVRRKRTTSEEDDSSRNGLLNLSDDDLLKICGGRTAHKAARHGHKLVGKLARITKQEEEHFSAIKGGSQKKESDHERFVPEINFVADNGEHKRKKKRKKLVNVEEREKNNDVQHEKCNSDNDEIQPITLGIDHDSVVDRHKKKKKKKKRSEFLESTGIESEISERKKKKRHKSECIFNDSNVISEVSNENDLKVHGKRRKKKMV